MKQNKHFIGLVIIDLTCLIGGLFLGCMTLFGSDVPHEKRTPEEFRTHIQQVTSEEKLQRLFIADDEEIRALEHLSVVGRICVIGLSFAISSLALINLVVVILGKNQKQDSST